MTPQELARMLDHIPPQELARLDHATLYGARGYLPSDKQGRLSPYEHRAFAREATNENPLLALPIAAGTLAYQPYKAIFGARSAPSFSQVGQGLLGVGEGLYGAGEGLLGRVRGLLSR
jgi:hypothetical protein